MSRIALAAAFAAFLALPALAAEERLSGAQILATVSGNTIEGSMTETGRYSEFYDADGTIKGVDYTGTWSVEGDTMCFSYGGDPADCWEVGKAGGEVLWIKDGAVLGTGAIREGNPNAY